MTSAGACAVTAAGPLDMDKLAEIRRLYYGTSRATIQRDLERAIDVLKSMATDDERQRAAVYMDGLSQMRSEWNASSPKKRKTPET
jgi:hypothetical protein